MIYSDYKDAAERHIEVCLQLVNVIEQIQKKEQIAVLSPREQLDKRKILANLYYLSGYIIECSYNCAIYTCIGWTSTVTSLKANSTTYNVSCWQDSSAAFVIRRSGSGIKQHQLSGNMNFFQTVVPIVAANQIPLIGYDIFGRVCYDLFDNWNAEVRYLIAPSVNLDYDPVFDFYFLSVEVYEGLIKNSLI